MTREDREKAIEILRADDISGYSVEDILSAREMAIKALEQEPILDKIRAEIKKLRPNIRPEQMTDYDYAMVEVVHDVVAIINKYKAESEE